jgi:Ran GTPase-activating protein (RanGAP) involved in mRNA processing and transport
MRTNFSTMKDIGGVIGLYHLLDAASSCSEISISNTTAGTGKMHEVCKSNRYHMVYTLRVVIFCMVTVGLEDETRA